MVMMFSATPFKNLMKSPEVPFPGVLDTRSCKIISWSEFLEKSKIKLVHCLYVDRILRLDDQHKEPMVITKII